LPSNGKKYQGEPLHPCNCINLFMVPRGDWRVNSKDSARAEMNVDTDEIPEIAEVASGLSVRVLGEEPGLGQPNQPRDSLPQIPDDALLVPARDRPGRPHLSGCAFYQRPVTEPVTKPVCTCTARVGCHRARGLVPSLPDHLIGGA
jgi:hypothetical protein